MVYAYSISIEGLRSAERDMDLAARRIAAPAKTTPPESSVDSAGQTSPLVVPSAPSSTPESPDYVVELLNVSRAKTAAEANLKVLESEAGLEKETLNLLA